MIKTKKRSIIFVLIGSLLAISPLFVFEKSNYLAFAQQADTADEFNANYLISDDEMEDYDCMGRSDIQAFLDDYESFLATFRTEDKDGTTRLASDIIYRAAQEYKINPKYILVKLQKEQSLITNQNPTDKQLDGATGYGITDGCGWSCDSYLRNKGFGKQVDSAAGIIRWYYDNVDKELWIKRKGQSAIIDGQLVIPQNYATAFLYTYTPHLTGNKNFWNLWNKWFGQVFPDGTLARGFTDPTVYLIQNSEKRAIKSMAVLMSRFDPKMIVKIPDSELNNIPNGKDISLPNYSILKQGIKYYLVDFDTIRPFESYEVVKQLGYNPGEIVEVQSDDLEGYHIGKTIELDNTNPFGRLVRINENKKLYYIKDNIIHPITDEKIAKINFPNITEEKINMVDIQNYEIGEMLKYKDGTLLGITGSNKIYVIENGKKRHIASEEVYNAYGYNWNNIVWTDEFTGINHPTAQPIYLPTRLADATKNNVQTVSTKTNSTTPTTTKTEPTSTQNSSGETPVIEENGKMYTISEDQTVYTGPTFDTNINTYLVADYNTGEILAGKNIDVVRPAASFTKALSAYRLMIEGLNLNKTTTYNAKKHKAIYHQFRIAEGEKILNEHLLYALLVSSLNTPARMLISNVEDNEPLFIKRMNEQIKDWILSKSKFVDADGYDLGNITTAREYLTIFTNTEKNRDLRKVLSMKDYEYDEILDLDGKPHHFDYNTNELMNTLGLPFKVIASKTAYLNEAGAGLTMIIERPDDERQFVIITMGNPDYNNRFSEPKKLVTWAINNF
ncbi:MAG: hypothetical protein WA057_01905 [Candidatus Magasanikiibacteriota bacterium]